MSDQDDRDRELAELKAQVARLSAGQQTPPTVKVTGGPSSGGGFKGGFFGCLGAVAAVFAIIVGLVALGQCSKSVVSTTASSSATPSATASASPGANWVYTSTADAMSDKETKKACTTSTNEIVQAFPYHNTTAHLCVRQSPKWGLDAFVELDDSGQILCGIESCSLPVRFDKKPTQKYPAVGAADNSTNIIFIRRSAGLVAELKKSSSTAVEVTLFENGVQPLTFNTAGLEWPPERK
jgi:hypothetical protein